MKREEVYREQYYTITQLREAVAEYVHFYNHERPHQRLSYRTPVQVEEAYKEMLPNKGLGEEKQ